MVSTNNEGPLQEMRQLQFWESQKTRPEWTKALNPYPQYFKDEGQRYLGECLEHPFLPTERIKQQQFARVQKLVELAYNDIPVYRDKYQSAGFRPSDLNCFDDIQRIPVITKQELIAAFPDRCLNPRFPMGDLFPTRSSGSSGQTLLIRVDEQAILVDTIQGIRQFALQSGRLYRPEHLVAHVYTVPWWYDEINGGYHSAFVSNVIPPERVADHLRELSPQILSCYPSNLAALLPYADQFKDSVYLTVTHSEASTRAARMEAGQRLHCPVLDEYSSEEATRIALELPCGHYHVCEDTVVLDILDPQSLSPQQPGQAGIAVITNLLNTAMPFIRYVQGDLVTAPSETEACAIQWSQLASLDGRLNDAFINKALRSIPAGSLLDITYRWMFDRDLHLRQFELCQKTHDQLNMKMVLGQATKEEKVHQAMGHLEELLGMCMEHPVHVRAEIVNTIVSGLKQRPIRCELAS